jgi:predicted lipid-binding transport protein (Tim44 family)
MSLSAREQRILSEIENHLTAAEPLLGRALAGMRLRHWRRLSHHRLRSGQGWAVAMLAGLLAGIALLTAGLVLGMLAMVIGGTALTQLSLVVGWLARALSTRQHARR